jgi:predicted nucleic acid-binding protein
MTTSDIEKPSGEKTSSEKTSTDRVLVDTNVLLYAHLNRSPMHAPARTRMEELEAAGAELWISRQTIREFLQATTTPGVLTGAVPMPALLDDVRHMLGRFRIAEEGSQATEQLLFLLSSIPITGKQIHDAALVATMRANQIDRLLTHNATDFARFGSVITVLPL